jgi:outer membrane lipoprotein-sorting protein
MFAKISIRTVFSVAVLAAAFGLFSVPSYGQLTEIVRRMDNFNKGLSSLKADVTMVKTFRRLESA